MVRRVTLTRSRDRVPEGPEGRRNCGAVFEAGVLPRAAWWPHAWHLAAGSPRAASLARHQPTSCLLEARDVAPAPAEPQFNLPPTRQGAVP